MKKILLAAALTLLVSACGKEGAQSSGDAATDNVSYNLGLIFGSQFRRDFNDINVSEFNRGIKTALAEEQAQEVMQKANATVQEYHAAKRKKLADSAVAKSEAFLAENAKREGVTTTESGLQYEVLTEGKGKQPVATDEVTVHYRGTTPEGKEFDSSYSRGKPATFQLNRVIAGWTEGLQLMKEGAKYKFAIPANLAYGERGAGANIGPNQALVFEVELVKIGKAEEAPKEAKAEKK